jgi:hypothetical protein
VPARTRTPDNEATVTFDRLGEPTIRLVVPADKILLRTLVLLLAHRELRPGDKLEIAAGDVSEDDLPAVNRQYGG